MAMKTFYATKDMKHPKYRTRMLKAGDPVDLTGPQARFYGAIDAIDENPPRAVPVAAVEPAVSPPAKRTVKRPATPKRTAKKAK